MKKVFDIIPLLETKTQQAVRLAEYLQLFEQISIASHQPNLITNGHNIDLALTKLGCTPLGSLVQKLPDLGLPTVPAEDITVSSMPHEEGGVTITIRSSQWTLEVISRGDTFVLSVESSDVRGLLASLA